MNVVYRGDNLSILKTLPDSIANLIYIDPPFNTGKIQEMDRIKIVESKIGDRVGFNNKSYQSIAVSSYQYKDMFDSYVEWLMERISESYRLLTDNGSMFVHLDYREVHYVKVALDLLFGRYNMMNEIIWSYDYGGRGKRTWPRKHDNILWYVKDVNSYTFNYDAIDRLPYMAPELVTPEKRERGKIPTDVWWNTIVPTNGKERTGYPTQKPLAIIDRIVKVHSNPNDTILDFFAGSGTLGVSSYKHDRKFILIDENEQAIEVMKKRFIGFDNLEWK
jgi:site-specific DNA-methyltransferase (adenine-specific)